jgi:hypothetical protein
MVFLLLTGQCGKKLTIRNIAFILARYMSLSPSPIPLGGHQPTIHAVASDSAASKPPARSIIDSQFAKLKGETRLRISEFGLEDQPPALGIVGASTCLLDRVSREPLCATNIKKAIYDITPYISAVYAEGSRPFDPLRDGLVRKPDGEIDWAKSGTKDGNPPLDLPPAGSGLPRIVLIEPTCEKKELTEDTILPFPANTVPSGPFFSMNRGVDGKKVAFDKNDHDAFVDRAAGTFSGDVVFGKIPPGTVLVRYCQKESIEPGQFWSELDDIALILNDIRQGLAVAPEWNQDGFLEMLVVPEDIPLESYSGKAASQKLSSGMDPNIVQYYFADSPDPGNFWLAGGTKQHFIPREALQGPDPYQEALRRCIMVVPETGLKGFTTGPK